MAAATERNSVSTASPRSRARSLGIRLAFFTSMPLLARKISTNDDLADALLAAELGEPGDTGALGSAVLDELFDSMTDLHVSVPYATLRLLGRLASDGRADVRARAARALGWFVDAYPRRVEELLLPLACDSSRKVRTAAAEALADLIPVATDPWKLMEEWEAHPDRARAVLQVARRSLPPPLGV
jgi:HEAT repeat protein